jgi:hypothetical protein
MSLDVKAITFPQGKLGRFGRQKKLTHLNLDQEWRLFLQYRQTRRV